MTGLDILHPARLGLAALLALSLSACGPRTGETERAQAPAPQPARTEAEVDAGRALDASALARIDAELTRLAEDQHRSGYVLLIARDGELRHTAQAGYADIVTGAPMTADTVVRIASMTKPVTAAAILILSDDGLLSVDQPVSDFIPAFADTRVASSTARNEDYEIPTTALERPITIEDLLTHTSGLGYVFDYQTNLGALYLAANVYEDREMSQSERTDTLAALPLYSQPGEIWRYSWSNDVLGQVIEAASGQSFEDFAQARIFQPLGMDSTTFFPARNPAIRDRVATLYTHDEDVALVPVAPERDFTDSAHVAAGGAGLFSTANDYLRFAQMLANGGELDGARILSTDSVAAMTTAHIGPDRMPEEMNRMNMGFGYSLGVVHDGDGETPAGQVGDFGWAGYFDTDFLVSPSTGLVAVILAQELPGPATPARTGAQGVFRPMVYSTLGQPS